MPRILPAIVALALVLAACGRGPETEVRWAVAARGLGWVDASAVAPARPVATTWRWDGARDPGTVPGADGWRPGHGTTAVVRDGRLVLSGDGPLTLLGPGGFAVDPERDHALALRFAATEVAGMAVAWRAADEGFAANRRLSDLPVVADGKLHNHLQPLDGLRGVGDATDALAGLAE
ncbi:MAG: hypothetical protein ACYTG2_17120, partial [Planctomycetota bacterium]